MTSTDTFARQNTGLFDRAAKQATGMLDTVEVMFARAVDSLTDPARAASARRAVFEMDEKVDAAQREIRRNLVEHLSAEPKQDAVGCLILMVIAKDAERAGDYCKGLTELADLALEPFGTTKYGKELRKTFADVKELFAPARATLGGSALELARRVVRRCSDLRTRCTSAIQTIARDGELTENQAVCLALAFRGCRRLSAHLANIASIAIAPPFGAIGPESELDDRDEPGGEGELQ